MSKNRSRVVGSFNKSSTINATPKSTQKEVQPLWPSLSDQPKQPHMMQKKITIQTFTSPVQSISTKQSAHSETLQFLQKRIEATLEHCANDLDLAVELLLEIVDISEYESASPTLSLSALSISDVPTLTLLESESEFIYAESSLLSRDAHINQPTQSDSDLFTAFIASSSTPAEFLANLFSHGPVTILRVLEDEGYDLVAAHYTLSYLPPELEEEPEVYKDIAMLMGLFPGTGEEEVWDLLQKHGNDVDAVAEVLGGRDKGPLDTLREMFPSMDEGRLCDALQSTESLDGAIAVLVDYPRRVVKRVEKFRIGSSLQSSMAGSTPSKQPSVNAALPPLVHDSAYYRSEASETHTTRVALYRRATESYRQGSLTGKGSAVYYAQEAHTLTQRMKTQNEHAAQQIMEENRARTYATLGKHYDEMRGGGEEGKGMIDLHGLTVNEAQRFALEYVTKYFLGRCGGVRVDRRWVRVVTGRGMHSEGGVARLYPALTAFFRKKGYGIEHGNGRASFLVREA